MADISQFQLAGMNRVLNPFLIKAGDLKLCLNYNSDIFYAKLKRNGYSLFLNNPDNLTVNNLIPFDRNDGYRLVLRNSGTSLYKYAFTGSTWGSAVKSNYGGINDQIQTIGDTVVANAKLDATTDKLGQGIKVSGAGSKTVPSLWILLNRTGATPGSITLKIETDTTGTPSGTAVTNGTATITSASVPVSTTSPTWVRVDFSTAPVLTAGTQYHLTIAAAATLDASNYYQWYGSAFDVYSNGAAKFSTNSGTNYASLTGELDLAFVINVRQASRVGSAILDNKLLLGNGVDQTCWTADGANFTNISTAPPCKYWITWKGRAYGIGNPLARSRLYFSATPSSDISTTGYPRGITYWTNDPTDVSTGGYLDIDPDSNGSGIGLDVENGRLIVHKEGGSYKIIPDEFGRPSQVISRGASTTSHWSIGRSEEFNISYFFNLNGIYEDNGETPDLKSSPIQDLIEAISGTATDNLVGHFFKYKYFCTMGTSITENERLGDRTFTNPLFVYELRLQEIYIYTTAHPVNCLASWKDENGVDNMYMGDTSGNTFKWDTSHLDYQTPIAGEIETWDEDFDTPHIKKRYEYIDLETNPGCESNALFKLDTDNPITLGDLTKGSTSFEFGDSGFNKKNIALKITDNSSTAPSIIYGWVIRLAGEEAPPKRRTRAK